jgi:mRNA interferase MazF
MTFSQGDIVIVEYPFTSNLSSKVRPAIVISNNLVNSTQDVILAQITSKPRIDNFSFKLEISFLSIPLKNNLESQVRCHKLFVMEKSKIMQVVSNLNKDQREKLLQKIVGLLEVK